MQRIGLIFSLFIASLLLTIGMVPRSWGNSTQLFIGINYDNPALLNLVKDKQIITGMVLADIYHKFNGVVAGVPGRAVSAQVLPYPYFRYAARLSERLVLGLDLTTPYANAIKWPLASFIIPASTTTLVNTYEIIPKMSYKINDRWIFGLGLNAIWFNVNAFDVFVPGVGYLVNRGNSWGYGWEAGLQYILNAMTFIDASYFSRIRQNPHGESFVATLLSTNFNGSPFTFSPATYMLQLIRLLSENWVGGIKVAYSVWDTDTLFINNTALGSFNIRLYPRNTWMASVFSHYHFNTHWGIIGALGFDQSPVPPRGNIVAFPASNLYFIALGPSYKFCTGKCEAKFVAGAAFGSSDIRRPTYFGNVKDRYPFADVSLTLNV